MLDIPWEKLNVFPGNCLNFFRRKVGKVKVMVKPS